MNRYDESLITSQSDDGAVENFNNLQAAKNAQNAKHEHLR